jgi:hypothetical protein
MTISYKGASRQKWDSIETKMGQQRDKNGTVSRQKWDSKGTKMGQYRDKNIFLSRYSKYFVSLHKIFLKHIGTEDT